MDFSDAEFDFDAAVTQQENSECWPEPPDEPFAINEYPWTPGSSSSSPAAVSTPRCSHKQKPVTETPSPPVVVARKRLWKKSPRPAWMAEPPAREVGVSADAKPGETTSAFWAKGDVEHFSKLRGRNKYWWLFRKLRKWVSDKEMDKGSLPIDMLGQVHERWKEIPRQSKATMISYFLESTGADQAIKDFANETWPLSVLTGGEAFHTRSVLLTWNGSWGLPKESPTSLQTEQDVVSYCMELPQVTAMWESFQTFIEEKVELYFIGSWCASLEIASGTWEKERVLRLHIHAFLKSESKFYVHDSRSFMFQGSLPHKAQQLFGQSVRTVSSWAGHYYLLAPKRYGIFTLTNKHPFTDFMVSPEWIFNMVQNNKITYENARSELIRCGKGLCRRLADLDRWHAARLEQEMMVRSEQLQKKLRSTLKTFQRFDVVDKWLGENFRTVAARRKFLVITGPSGVGKTEFVRSLFEFGAVLELNCAGMEHVCLTGFVAQKHQCIFWDELSAAVIVQNRKVFQHPACWVDMGHSPTGQHVVRYWLNDAVSIVATNRWGEDLQALKSYSDRCWVEANAVVLQVTGPMWTAP